MSLLRPYQVPHAQALLKALGNYNAALDASDTGTGKTPVALQIFKWLGIDPLVICPRSVKPTWERWAEKIGVGAEVINYEKVKMPGRGYGELKPWGSGSFWKWSRDYAGIIFDEADRCGGLTTINSKMMIAAKRQAQFTLALSATIAEDVRQTKAIGYLLGLHDNKKWHNYLMAHGCKPDWTGRLVPDPDKYQDGLLRLHERIFPSRGARMRKSEIPGFPKTQFELCLLDNEKAEAVAEEAAESYTEHDLTNLHKCRRRLEDLMIDEVLDLEAQYGQTSRVAVFCSYKDTLDRLVNELQLRYGFDEIGWVDGSQTGDKGLAQRQGFIDRFQINQLRAIVVNSQAGGPGISLHDPTGKMEVTELIMPQFSGRMLKQILGRVCRDGGGFSQCFLLAFRGTLQEKIAEVVMKKADNLDLLNDAELNGIFI